MNVDSISVPHSERVFRVQAKLVRCGEFSVVFRVASVGVRDTAKCVLAAAEKTMPQRSGALQKAPKRLHCVRSRKQKKKRVAIGGRTQRGDCGEHGRVFFLVGTVSVEYGGVFAGRRLRNTRLKAVDVCAQ